MSYEQYPSYTDKDTKPLYFVEFHKWDEKSKTTWQLFRRQFMYPKEIWEKMDKGVLDSNEVHPWNLGEGVVNENENAIDMNTRKFLKFLVDALNEKVEHEKNTKFDPKDFGETSGGF